MIFLMMGPQGSGKGTQAKRLAEDFGLLYFDVGAHLREIAKTDTNINEIVNKRGALVPDSEIYKIVTSFLEEKGVFDNLVLDGYPRSTVQFELFNKWLSERGAKITKAISLKVSEEVSIKRLSARRIDPKTGEIYSLIAKLPSGLNINGLVQREDDKPEAIRERLRHYRQTTEPLISLLKEKGLLVELDGERSIDDIYIELSEKVKDKHEEV